MLLELGSIGGTIVTKANGMAVFAVKKGTKSRLVPRDGRQARLHAGDEDRHGNLVRGLHNRTNVGHHEMVTKRRHMDTLSKIGMGAVSTWRAAGLSGAELTALVRTGDLVKIRHGVYATAGILARAETDPGLRHALQVAAVTDRTGKGVASHYSAALVGTRHPQAAAGRDGDAHRGARGAHQPVETGQVSSGTPRNFPPST